MENMSRDAQRRVWERVQAMPEMKLGQLRELLYPMEENCGVYHQLSRQGSKDAEKLRQLHQQCRRSAACLRGLCRMAGEQPGSPRLSPPREPRTRALEKCYRRELGLLGEFESRAAGPENGAVFRALAQQTRDRCVGILELLGEAEK